MDERLSNQAPSQGYTAMSTADMLLAAAKTADTFNPEEGSAGMVALVGVEVLAISTNSSQSIDT